MQTKDNPIFNPVLRGDIYMVNLDPVIGREIGKSRPAVIIQNNIGNKLSPVTIIAPISSVKEITKPLPIMIFLDKSISGLKFDSYIDCGQIRTVDIHGRLIKKIGHLPETKISELNKALKISLDLF